MLGSCAASGFLMFFFLQICFSAKEEEEEEFEKGLKSFILL
jgi:hypothetical protein